MKTWFKARKVFDIDTNSFKWRKLENSIFIYILFHISSFTFKNKELTKILNSVNKFIVWANEEENEIISYPTRNGTVKFTKSADYEEFYKGNKDVKHDML